MGAAMTPHEFIEKNVHDELRKLKFNESVCFSVSRDAVDYYRQRSMFSKSVVLDVLAWSKKRAKELSR
ncbi:Transcriptional regulator [Pseudomonas chlororaphis]